MCSDKKLKSLIINKTLLLILLSFLIGNCSKKYHAHDEKNKFKVGDKVQIIESIPYSKKKKWKVVDK